MYALAEALVVFHIDLSKSDSITTGDAVKQLEGAKTVNPKLAQWIFEVGYPKKVICTLHPRDHGSAHEQTAQHHAITELLSLLSPPHYFP